MAHDDTRGWRPVRPPLLDYPISTFLFKELIRLFKKAEEEKISEEELAKLFSKEVINELEFVYVSLGWSPSELSYEDKMFLLAKLINLYEKAESEENFEETYERLEKEIRKSGNSSRENVFAVGTKIYMGYIKSLYERLGENWEKASEEGLKEVLAKKDSIRDPGPWGDTKEDAAIRKLVRNADFRREREKDLAQIAQGVPEVSGIAQGLVGQNIIVAFTIPTNPPDADAFITDIDAFKDNPIKEQLESEGAVVISKTRNGTKVLQKGQKVLVDGTSGIVYVS
jgi:hypothetical protein